MPSQRGSAEASKSRAGYGFSPFSAAKLSETGAFFNFLLDEHEDLPEPLFNFVEESYLMLEIEFQTDEKMDWLKAELSR